MTLNINKTGLAVGVFFAVVHVLWSLMLLLGIAAPSLKFVLDLHMLSFPFTTLAFSWGSALGLIVVTFVIGYLLGSIFAWVWNKFAR